MGLPSHEFGATFWLSVSGIVSALLRVLVKSLYKSKCSDVDLFCIKIKRDIAAEVEEDMAEQRNNNRSTETAGSAQGD